MRMLGRSFAIRLTALVVAIALSAGVAALSAAAPRRGARDIGVADVVERVLPSVVSIATRQIERDQFNRVVSVRGLGSGFIVDSRGYILTNAHVVEGAEQIKVTLVNQRSFRATLVGSDRFSDLAVVRIDAGNLPAATLGDSGSLRVGESVIAVGSPLWIEGGPTVTLGVVSGRGRSMEEPGLPMLHDLIQTDAAINPGNSGGPLLNLNGRVVGINTATIPSAHGIGFAISARTAKPVVEALIKAGRIVRPTIGVEAVSVTRQVAYANDLRVDQGVLVTRVEAGGPGERAGFKPGDVIVAVAGWAVKDLHHFHERLARLPIGQPVDVMVSRLGETISLRPVTEEYR